MSIPDAVNGWFIVGVSLMYLGWVVMHCIAEGRREHADLDRERLARVIGLVDNNPVGGER